MKTNSYKYFPPGRALAKPDLIMFTRRDILKQLKMAGLREFSALKTACRRHENYLSAFFDLEIGKKRAAGKPGLDLQSRLHARRYGNPDRYLNVRLIV